MAKTCKNCGFENRENASFCSQCGVPLQKHGLEANRAYGVRRKPFTLKEILIFVSVITLIAVAAFAFLKNDSDKRKIAVYDETRTKFSGSDAVLFSGVKEENFIFEKLRFGMTEEEIRKIYPFAKISNDPDFIASIMVPQAELKEPFPHANFMSLGMYAGRLYAIKFEFGPSEDFQRQVVKIPDADFRLYGRYEGIATLLKGMLGRPDFEKNEAAEKSSIPAKVKYIKDGVVNGKGTNVYIYWIKGGVKTEVVLFSINSKLHFTLRFLDNKIWEKIGKK